jgi:hypothetical protein
MNILNPDDIELDSETTERVKQANGERVDFQILMTPQTKDGDLVFLTLSGMWVAEEERIHFGPSLADIEKMCRAFESDSE